MHLSERTIGLPGAGSLQVQLPVGWQYARRSVPLLRFPRELFTIANRRIPTLPPNSDQPRPMVSQMDRNGLLIWCYCQLPDEPNPTEPDAIPEYREFQAPLDYLQSDVRPAHDAREWDPSDFLWRRIGFQHRSIQFTIWIWEGTMSSAPDIDRAAEVVKSIALVD